MNFGGSLCFSFAYQRWLKLWDDSDKLWSCYRPLQKSIGILGDSNYITLLFQNSVILLKSLVERYMVLNSIRVLANTKISLRNSSLIVGGSCRGYTYFQMNWNPASIICVDVICVDVINLPDIFFIPYTSSMPCSNEILLHTITVKF